MRKLYGWFVVVFVLLSGVSKATHIVGGEFEMLHVQGFTYQFKLIQYFDLVNGLPGAKDLSVNASVFRKRDNAYIRNIFMPLRAEEDVKYTNPECTIDRLQTRRLEYNGFFELNPSLFSDPQGYYIVYERCCRNNIITNIQRPDRTGQTFYLEFPPIVKDGQPFVNSSPRLFPPLSDYACAGRDFYVDFRGSDPDGDSLAYSLVAPLNSSTEEALPTPRPSPHPLVVWQPGYSAQVQITGDPPLNINSEGFLTIRPASEGLFVFSVLCEEFRAGVKIGEVRRDFQMFVIDCPSPGSPPNLVVRDPSNGQFVSELGDLQIAVGDNRCIELAITDKDGGENVRLRARPVNFSANLQSFFSVRGGFIPTSSDTLFTTFCFPDCPIADVSPLIFDIIAEDRTCPLPLKDTLRIRAFVETGPANRPPQFVTPASKQNQIKVTAGDIIQFELKATDADDDSLRILFFNDFGSAVQAQDVGIRFDTLSNIKGEISVEVSWDVDCTFFPFGQKSQFNWSFVVEDIDECGNPLRDTVHYYIEVDPFVNQAPIIKVDGKNEDGFFVVQTDGTVKFTITAEDPDPDDKLILELIAAPNLPGFSLEIFPDGNTSRAEAFWQVPCIRGLVEPREYVFRFRATDDNICKNSSPQFIEVVVLVEPKPNQNPKIVVPDGFVNDTLTVIAGKEASFNLLASDGDGDEILLSLLNASLHNANLGVEFTDVMGRANVSSGFTWQTDCDLLSEDFGESVFAFTFSVEDDACPVIGSSTKTLYIKVTDLIHEGEFMPPNVFTPNPEDDINLVYHIPEMPEDNCRNQFQEILIYNRWGKEVFRSQNREFSWDGEGMSNGVYFMILYYTRQTIKGTVSIIR
ncbi:MAG: gliding motility-associated C-terminal domain-containing protein [Cyclobacteriaceae bacterium]|nr:gliding motility-associated C-terminal domain-containing protein [Cyclobacteriaceae bacterium]